MDKIKIGIRSCVLEIMDWVKDNPLEFGLLLIILLAGAFLRLYRISEYMIFLGDEGRDVIVVRRLLVYADPILVGPGTSIGNMYLGPLYYYMMAPFLFLANFSPVGPAAMVALLGVATIFLVWAFARELFGNTAALVASSLYAISPTVIIYSKSSWNPNIMPFFALLTIYSIWKVWEDNNFRWLIVGGISYAFVLQSHYLGLLLLPTIGIFWFLSMKKMWGDDKKRLIAIQKSLITAALFALLMSPLVIFDARHGWRNFAAMKKFFAERQTTVSARPWNAIPKLYPIFEKANTRLVAGRNETAGKVTTILILVGLSWIVLKKFSLFTKRYLLVTTWLVIAMIGLGLYKQEIYDHYYGFFFAAPFILLAALVEQAIRDKRKVIGYLVLISYFLLLITNLRENPLKSSPNQQLQRTQSIARKITEESKGQKFNLAVIAERNYEDAYQYFLELWGADFVEIDAQKADETITDQLFVVCEVAKEKCDPTHNPKAEIANFGWSEVDNEWEVSGVQLFKLGHTQ